MKQTIKSVFAVSCMLLASNLFSQTPTPPVKETIIIDKFIVTGNIGSAHSETIRSSVIAGFSEKNRMHVVDAATNDQLKKLAESKKSEDAVTISNVTEDAKAVFKSLNAKYILGGKTANFTSSYEDKTRDGKTKRTYKATFTYSLSGYNIETGAVVASENFEVYDYGDTEGEAINDALKSVSRSISRYINTNFPFRTYILQLEALKKDKLKELYICCGSEMGIQKGDIFAVLQEVSIGGMKTKKEVGRLRVTEVQEGVTKCTVVKGNEEILDAFQKANADPTTLKQSMVVESRGESFGKNPLGFL